MGVVDRETASIEHGGTVLEGIRKKVFLDRYSYKDRDGSPIEQFPEQTWQRVATAIAGVESTDDKRAYWADRFFDALRDFKFVPGGRILAGAGTGHSVTYYNCYVIPSPDDSRSGILDNLKIMTEIMARGGGVGINLSTLRPRGSYIRTVNGTASGPCSWGQLYSVATGDVIQQGGSRRGALMLMLDDDHPDIEEFITVKRRSRMIEHANLSVCVSDRFMEAVSSDGPWDLNWEGKVVRTIRGRELWNMICESAWTSAEPGVVFMDRYNRQSNTWYYENIRCVNPCGEQGLPPWGVCNLGALNLAAFVTAGELDYAALAEHARVAIRFLDDVIDANDYFIEENRIAQLGTRRTGLGTMGLADALLALEIRYGSDESLEVIDRIYTTIRDAAYDASCDIAAEKGPFPSFIADKYLQGTFIRRLPASIQNKIGLYGTRNAVILTQAPTGTTSLLAGVSSGIEPVFDFAMVRRDRTGEHILYHPMFQAWRQAHPDAPVPSWFVKSADLTPDEHVRVQALIQQYTDSSISKTVNAPNHHTVDQVDSLYRQAYELGCKGVTYYRDGSRDAVLTHLEEKKPEPTVVAPEAVEVAQLRPRPHVLNGATYRAPTPVGTAFVTINTDQNGSICEVFVTVGRAGTDVAADAEALGRLISLALRVPSGLSARSVAEAVIDQLAGIGGSASLGFGNARVRSLADAVAKVLSEHLSVPRAQQPLDHTTMVVGNGNGTSAGNGPTIGNDHGSAIPTRTTGDFCPKCGQIALVNEEGCHKCYVCGYSSC